MKIQVLENQKGQFSIRKENEDMVYTCRDQNLELISIDDFDEGNRGITDVSIDFSEKNQDELIIKKLNELETFKNEIAWPNSLSFVLHSLTGKAKALPKIPITQDDAKFLTGLKFDKSLLSPFINEIDPDLLINLNSFDTLKNECKRIPKVGDHLVIFSYTVGLEKSPHYLVLQERHGIVVEDGWEGKVICSEGVYRNNCEIDCDQKAKISSLDCFLNLNSYGEDSFGFAKHNIQVDIKKNNITYISVPGNHYSKPYFFENSEVESTKIKERVIEYSSKIEKDGRLLSFRKTIASIQTGNDRATPKGFSIRQTSLKWQIIKLRFHIIKELIRSNTKYSIQEIAKYLNVSRQTINNWTNEKNTKRDIPLDKLLKIADLFQIVPHHLVFPYISGYPLELPKPNALELEKFKNDFSSSRTSMHDNNEKKLLLECDKKLAQQLKVLSEKGIHLELPYVDKFITKKTRNLVAKKIDTSVLCEYEFTTEYLDNQTKEYFIEDTVLTMDLIYYHNIDDHLAPEIKKDDYLLVDKSYDNYKIEKCIKELILFPQENMSNARKYLGIFLIQLDNFVVNANVYFDKLSKEIILTFLNDNSVIKVDIHEYSASTIEGYYEILIGDAEIVNSSRPKFKYTKFMGKVYQIIRTV